MPYKDLEKRKAYNRKRCKKGCFKDYYWKDVEKSRADGRERYKKQVEQSGKTYYSRKLGQFKPKKVIAKISKLPKSIEEKKYTQAKCRARYRKKEFNLEFDFFNSLLSSKCHYCGNDKAGTIDRIDSKVGYSKDNVVASCLKCNVMKNSLSVDEFISHIESIYKHLFEN